MGFVKGVIRQLDNGHIAFRCPGCSTLHLIRLRLHGRDHPSWEWDGSYDSPTLNPSVYVNPPGANHNPKMHTCHAYVRRGMIQFLPDSTHDLKGQTVPLPPME